MEELENIQGGDLDRFLEGLPLKFRVMNIRLSVETQMEFLEILGKLEEPIDIEVFNSNRERLLDSETPLDERKLLLAQFAMIDDVEVMRVLERYAETCPDDVKDFAQMAAYQSKLFLEAAILGENQVVVASGLGGEGDKMRFCVALISRNREPLSEVQQQIVQKELVYQLKQNNAEAESVEFDGCYVRVLALIPMRSNVKGMFEQCVEVCNELGDFLDNNMVISTVKVLTVEDLDRIVNEGEKNDTENDVK